MIDALVPGALLLHILAGTATLAVARSPRWSLRIAFLGAILALVSITRAAWHVLVSGQPLTGVLFDHAASSLIVDYAVTPLSAWFLLVLGTVSIPVSMYSVSYLRHAVPASRLATVGIAFNVMVAAVVLVFTANSVVGFLFGWELMTLATAALVATEYESLASRRAAYLFLVMSHLGTGALVAGFFTLVSLSGSVSLPVLLSGNAATGTTRQVLFWLFLFGFGVKAGIIPVHIWLPEAHPAAPSSISAFMSAVLITTGIYGLVRVCAFGLGPPDAAWGLTCMGLGAVTGVLGVLYALTSTDIKRMLAYSTIENSGVMLLGLGTGMTLLSTGRPALATVAIAASLYHVLNHAAFKGLLFLAAGSVVMATATRQIEEMGGLLRRMPRTGLAFLIGALAIAGVPPLNGFISEWLTFQSLLLGFHDVPGLTRVNFPLAGALLALTSALAAVCFVRGFGITFLALPRGRGAEHAHESPGLMLLSLGLLALVCLVLGLLPGQVLTLLGGVVTTLPGLSSTAEIVRGPFSLSVGPGPFGQITPALVGLGLAVAFIVGVAVIGITRVTKVVRQTPTWGCGGRLTPQTEYTATAFSKPLQMIFREIYRPTRELEALAEVSPYFPREVRYREEVEPTFERHLYDPLVAGVLGVAERLKIVQAGSLHAYLGYVLVLGAVLLLWLGGQ